MDALGDILGTGPDGAPLIAEHLLDTTQPLEGDLLAPGGVITSLFPLVVGGDSPVSGRQNFARPGEFVAVVEGDQGCLAAWAGGNFITVIPRGTFRDGDDGALHVVGFPPSSLFTEAVSQALPAGLRVAATAAALPSSPDPPAGTAGVNADWFQVTAESRTRGFLDALGADAIHTITLPAATVEAIVAAGLGGGLVAAYWDGQEWLPVRTRFNAETGQATVTTDRVGIFRFLIYPQRTLVVLPGWNGLTYTGPINNPVERFVEGLGSAVESVWRFDGQSQRWQSWIRGAPAFLNTLTRLNPGEALFVRVTEGGAFRSIDVVPAPDGTAARALRAGANLVSYTGASGAAADVLSDIGGLISAWRFNAATQQWEGWNPSVPAAVNQVTQLRRGVALFLILERDATWSFSEALPSGAIPARS